MTKQKLKVLVIADKDLIPPENIDSLQEREILRFKNEYDVISTLRKIGHEVRAVGVANDVRVIRNSAEEFSPHVVFNVMAEMHGYSMFEPHVVSYLELLKLAYTGCNPRGLMLAHDKALTKKILTYHRIATPAFVVFPMNRKPRRNNRLHFPLLVKSLVEEGSIGISQASLVNDEKALSERVEFIHRKIRTNAIAEEYIQGRELYMAILGNQRLQSFTPWELVVENLPEGAPLLATGKMKWDMAYQKKMGVVTKPAELSIEQRKHVERLSKRIYRNLSLSGYARLDFRLSENGTLYFLEANPNPDISAKEDFAMAANHSGLEYEEVLQKILELGIRYRPSF